MNKFEKAQKNLKNDLLLLFILELIFIVYSIFNNSFDFLTVIFALVFVILLFVGYTYAKKGTKAGEILGIIIGIFLMFSILNFDIIDFLLGLFVVLHSFKYNKLIKSISIDTTPQLK